MKILLSPFLVLPTLSIAFAQTAPAPSGATLKPATPDVTLSTIVVTGALDTQRDEIAPNRGATVYSIGQTSAFRINSACRDSPTSRRVSIS
jgi:hypothetical protein